MEWKKIDGYENYSVSSEGIIRNDNTGRILKKFKCEDGYEKIQLCKNRKIKNFKVHRLVAEAFIPNPFRLPCVDHINTIRYDNRVENLRWCTQKENCNNPLSIKNNSKAKKGKQFSEEHKQKLSKVKKGENHPRSRKVICVTTGEIFICIKQASEKYGVTDSNISLCCKGKYKSAGKHPETGEKLVWKYYDEV